MTRFIKPANLLFIFVVMLSCNSVKEKKENCIYTLNKMYKDYDSNRLPISKFKDETDVFDSSNNLHERGIYKFDNNNRLFFYAYLIDDSNNYYFGIEYDSLGNIIQKKGGEVVRWFKDKPMNDSITLSFLFYGVNFSYSNISLQVGNDKIKIDTLCKSFMFSNLIGNCWKIPLLKYPKRITIYISGWKKNLCTTNDSTFFKDSVYASNISK